MDSDRIRLKSQLRSEWLNLKNQHGRMFVPPEQIGMLPVHLMIVGESPAMNEVEQGKPFVGYSGEILRAKLTQYSFRKMQWNVYITNAVKIASFDSDGTNLNPTSDDIDKWRNLIIQEIVAYNPKAILLLGGSALYSVAHNTDSISSLDINLGEKRITWGSVTSGLSATPTLFLTYHPSSLWRNEEYSKRYDLSWSQVVQFLRESK